MPYAIGRRDWKTYGRNFYSKLMIYMGVSKSRGTPKWMVYNGKPYQNGWFGGTTISGNIHMLSPDPKDRVFFERIERRALSKNDHLFERSDQNWHGQKKATSPLAKADFA